MSGTVGDWNRRMAGAPVVSAERLIGAGGLVVLAPHPDDETIGASALLIAAGRLGRRIGIAALTDGDASHPRSALFPPARLAAIRREEQAAAVRALGCAEAAFLRLALPDGASGRSAGFEGAAERVAAFCRNLSASALAAPHPDDPHPDHHAAAELAARVRERLPQLRLLAYEVWSRRLADAEPFRQGGLTPFRVATDVAPKRAALGCHRSQLGGVVSDDPDGFVLPDWFLAAQEEPLERVSWHAMPGRVPEAAHFEKLYANDGDPWHVRSSAYERGKREASVAALSGRRYAAALEIGCGEGFLTRALVDAGVAARALGIDREPAVVARAARHPANGPDVAFAAGSAPDDLPEGPFDLAVLSEVLYFLDEAGLAALAQSLRARLTAAADILVVCYLGRTDTPLSGRDAGDFFVACLGAAARVASVTETPDYRIERLECLPAPA